ncbi:MAG: mechanosensitive ion channel [Flavobacteriaceae bacterium]|nr:mechanosensitive ion channel [Flavobacteriaceae bacterium]
MEFLENFLDIKIIRIGEGYLSVSTLLIIALTLLATKFILWLIKKALYSKYRFKKLDQGNSYALFQIIKYLLWVIAWVLILDAIGVKVTVLIAGSAALMVGVGLGLQHTFNDFISGIILLSEGTTRVGDVLQIDDQVLIIKSIGLRTSKALNRENIVIIIPNSLITNNKVINWSHQSKKTRFKIDIGVAYGSDVNLVIKTLEESVLEHPDVFDKKMIEIRFVNFGNSSLDFEVLFFSKNVFRIERVKSDIRKIIIQKFIENSIKIPFPQIDLHLKN